MSTIVVRAKSHLTDTSQEVPEYEFRAVGIREQFVTVDGDISEDDAFEIESLVTHTQKTIMPLMYTPKKGTMRNFIGVTYNSFGQGTKTRLK